MITFAEVAVITIVAMTIFTIVSVVCGFSKKTKVSRPPARIFLAFVACICCIFLASGFEDLLYVFFPLGVLTGTLAQFWWIKYEWPIEPQVQL